MAASLPTVNCPHYSFDKWSLRIDRAIDTIYCYLQLEAFNFQYKHKREILTKKPSIYPSLFYIHLFLSAYCILDYGRHFPIVWESSTQKE